MPAEQAVPGELYTAEASQSRRRSKAEAEAPDPGPEEAARALEEEALDDA